MNEGGAEAYADITSVEPVQPLHPVGDWSETLFEQRDAAIAEREVLRQRAEALAAENARLRSRLGLVISDDAILGPGHPAMVAIGRAMSIAEQWGHIGIGQHKAWVIDQMVRELTGVDYEAWVAAYEADGATWDTGVAP